MVFETMVCFAGFFVFNRNVTDETMVDLTFSMMAQGMNAFDSFTVSTDIVLTKKLIATADGKHRSIVFNECRQRFLHALNVF